MRDEGYGDPDLAKARSVVEAVHAVVRPDLRGGWDKLAAVKKAYRHEPWAAGRLGLSPAA